MRRPLAFVIVTLSTTVAAAPAQTPADQQRARTHNQLGWELMTAESWGAAARSFQQAIDINPRFAYAFYGLGRANIALKKYVAAIAALSECRDLYEARLGRQFSSQQEAQRYRQDRITEIDEQIRQVQSGPQSLQIQDLLRQLNNQRRDIQNAIQSGSGLPLETPVPPWVSLSLGSAYFRAARLPDAEREYKAAIAADPQFGEAHSNLAVVYLETGRIADADASLKAAKKAGFRVNPQLEQAIKERMKN